ncbi:ornithine aminotransferase [[Candida] railenensis]|uniref:Ornithine aminotransferase n=1 Tax=[Candida] railenensis TaxID=45579 RepID=A0A9P0QWA3_9ASCO|nr:ornithine aminotransferase [[Candida] railenensis]
MTVTQESLLFSGPVNKKLPMVVDGKGNYLIIEDAETKEQKKILDACGGAAVCALGHKDDDVVKIIAEASTKCLYSFSISLTNYYAEELAKFYIENSPEGAFAGALWTCSGSESNENAMKTIRQYWKEKGEPERTIFVSRKQSYHGYTTGCMALSDSNRSKPFDEITLPSDQVPKVSQVYPYRHLKEGETIESYTNRLLEEVEETFIKAGPNKVACFLAETLSGSTFGTSPSLPGYLAGLRKVCDKYGVLLWLDEVMCGTGRCSATGGLNCWESYPDFKGPDIQTVGKTLGSGVVTIAGVLVSPKVKNTFVEGTNMILGGQTYHQHAFNCYVALEIQKKIQKEGLRQNVFNMGELLGKTLKEKGLNSSKYKTIGDVRGLGGFWSLEIVKNKETKEPFDPSLKVGSKISAKALENGLVCMGLAGTVDAVVGDHVTLAPTFIVNEEDISKIAELMLQSISEVEADLIAAGEL